MCVCVCVCVCVCNIMLNSADTALRCKHFACTQHEDAVHEIHVPIWCLNKPVTATGTDHALEGIIQS